MWFGSRSKPSTRAPISRASQSDVLPMPHPKSRTSLPCKSKFFLRISLSRYRCEFVLRKFFSAYSSPSFSKAESSNGGSGESTSTVIVLFICWLYINRLSFLKADPPLQQSFRGRRILFNE